jgi:cobalt-zinc-cadmium efflux system protein
MVKAGVGLVRESGRILLEAAPAGLHPDMIGDALVTSDGVVEVHDLHVWTITSGQPALSAHVLVEPGRDCHQIRNHLESLLRDDYQLTHTTLQVDHAGSDLLRIGETVHCEDAHGPAHTNAEHRH